MDGSMHHSYTAAVEMLETDLLFPFLRLIGTWEGHHTPPGWSLGWPGSIDDVPEVHDCIWVWAMDRSVNSHNSFIIQGWCTLATLARWDLRNPPRIHLDLSNPSPNLAHWKLKIWHQIILHGVSRLYHVCHMCSVWTGCHLQRDQGAGGKSAKSPVLRGGEVPGCQNGSPLLDARPFYHPYWVGFRWFGQKRAQKFSVRGYFVGVCSASHLQCNSVAGCSPATTCYTVTTVMMMIISVVINNSSNNNLSSVLFNILPLKFKSQNVKVKFVVDQTMKLVQVISQRIKGVISPYLKCAVKHNI